MSRAFWDGWYEVIAYRRIGALPCVLMRTDDYALAARVSRGLLRRMTSDPQHYSGWYTFTPRDKYCGYCGHQQGKNPTCEHCTVAASYGDRCDDSIEVNPEDTAQYTW